MNWLERARTYLHAAYEKNMGYEAAKDQNAFIDDIIDQMSNVELLRLMEEIDDGR